MKATIASAAAFAFLLQFVVTASAQDIPVSEPAAAVKGAELAALEKKLLGTWDGGACVGDYNFKSDGSFELKFFTPGNNTLTGTWSIRWDALPPTLVLMAKTSDFQTKDPTRPEYEYLGKNLEVKLIELDAEVLVYRLPDGIREMRYERPTKIAERLLTKLNIDFKRAPLQEAFAFIGSEIKVTIEIDGDALKAGGFTKNMPQTFQGEQMTAQKAIARILERYQEPKKPNATMVIVIDEAKNTIRVTTEAFCNIQQLTPYDVFKK